MTNSFVREHFEIDRGHSIYKDNQLTRKTEFLGKKRILINLIYLHLTQVEKIVAPNLALERFIVYLSIPSSDEVWQPRKSQKYSHHH